MLKSKNEFNVVILSFDQRNQIFPTSDLGHMRKILLVDIEINCPRIPVLFTSIRNFVATIIMLRLSKFMCLHNLRKQNLKESTGF